MIHSLRILKFDNKSVVPRSQEPVLLSSLSALDFANEVKWMNYTCQAE